MTGLELQRPHADCGRCAHRLSWECVDCDRNRGGTSDRFELSAPVSARDGEQSPTSDEREIDRLRLEVARLRLERDQFERAIAALVAAADACDREAERHPSSQSSAPMVRYLNAMARLRAVLGQGGDVTALLPDRDRLGYYRRAVLRAQVEVTPLDPMGRHMCCPFCRAPLDHHHDGRPRRTCAARACALKWRAVTRPPRTGEYAAKRARRARIGTARPGAKP